MDLLFTPDTGTTSKPQVKDIDVSYDEIVSIEDVQRWVQQYDESEKTVLDELRSASIRLLENSYNITLSVRNRTAYYTQFGNKVSLWFGPHTSISEVRIDSVINSNYKEYGFNSKILYFENCGYHLEVDFLAGTTNENFKKAVLMQIKFLYDGEWDENEKISPAVDKILMPYASIY